VAANHEGQKARFSRLGTGANLPPRRPGNAVEFARRITDEGESVASGNRSRLAGYAGSERVVEQLVALFPQADVFSLIDFLPAGERRFLAGRKVTTSFLQRFPFARRKYPAYLPLMPLATVTTIFSTPFQV
jgi:hypothetical protein